MNWIMNLSVFGLSWCEKVWYPAVPLRDHVPKASILAGLEGSPCSLVMFDGEDPPCVERWIHGTTGEMVMSSLSSRG